jgi:hypothetical protein
LSTPPERESQRAAAIGKIKRNNENTEQTPMAHFSPARQKEKSLGGRAVDKQRKSPGVSGSEQKGQRMAPREQRDDEREAALAAAGAAARAHALRQQSAAGGWIDPLARPELSVLSKSGVAFLRAFSGAWKPWLGLAKADFLAETLRSGRSWEGKLDALQANMFPGEAGRLWARWLKTEELAVRRMDSGARPGAAGEAIKRDEWTRATELPNVLSSIMAVGGVSANEEREAMAVFCAECALRTWGAFAGWCARAETESWRSIKAGAEPKEGSQAAGSTAAESYAPASSAGPTGLARERARSALWLAEALAATFAFGFVEPPLGSEKGQGAPRAVQEATRAWCAGVKGDLTRMQQEAARGWLAAVGEAERQRQLDQALIALAQGKGSPMDASGLSWGEFLLKEGANPNAPGPEGEATRGAALYWANERFGSASSASRQANEEAFALRLLEAGAAPESIYPLRDAPWTATRNAALRQTLRARVEREELTQAASAGAGASAAGGESAPIASAPRL